MTASAVTLTYPGASQPALDAVDLEVRPGECVALLGPNGAGKTTLVGCITGLLDPDEGRVRIAGGDPTRAATRRWLGVMLQGSAFPRHLTARELVGGAAVRAGRPAAAADAVLAEVGLTELAGRKSGKLSGGQRQRLQLARALVTEPALLVLDEPTVGLDADARKGFWQRLADRRDSGMAILLTTHLISEAGAVADRVAVIGEGRLIADTDPQSLADRLPDRAITARTTLGADEIATIRGIEALTVEDGELRITTRVPEEVLRRLLDRDRELTDLRVAGASLEEAVMAVTAGSVDLSTPPTPSPGPISTPAPTPILEEKPA